MDADKQCGSCSKAVHFLRDTFTPPPYPLPIAAFAARGDKGKDKPCPYRGFGAGGLRPPAPKPLFSPFSPAAAEGAEKVRLKPAATGRCAPIVPLRGRGKTVGEGRPSAEGPPGATFRRWNGVQQIASQEWRAREKGESGVCGGGFAAPTNPAPHPFPMRGKLLRKPESEIDWRSGQDVLQYIRCRIT